METIKEWWTVIMAAGGGLVWLLRLEGRATANSHEIERLWRQRREDIEAAREDRKEQLAIMTEIRADIKALMQRHV